MSAVMDFTDFLDNACARIAFLEAQAKDAISAENTTEYTRIMQEKASFLAALAEEGKPHIQTLPMPLQAQALQGLQRFSSSAQTALHLDSVFYMSALLFPDDHKEGQPNNLEDFAAHMRQSLTTIQRL